MPDPTPDPRATLELLTILERFDDADLNNRTWCESFADEIGPSVPTIIRDLRRLVDLEGKAQIGTHAADGSCWDWGRNHYECALRRLAEVEAENARLKRGEFTPEEFQGLCHHRDERPGCKAAEFFQGCEDYQRKLFGYAEADEMRKAINLLTREPSTTGYEVAAEWRDKCKAAESDRDAGWAAADALAEQMNRPLYERTCVCGDFESQHQGGGPCGVCCQSDRGGDGCEAFVPFSYERLTDVQKGLAAYTTARAKRTT